VRNTETTAKAFVNKILNAKYETDGKEKKNNTWMSSFQVPSANIKLFRLFGE
jgi:hypothetical protein